MGVLLTAEPASFILLTLSLRHLIYIIPLPNRFILVLGKIYSPHLIDTRIVAPPTSPPLSRTTKIEKAGASQKFARQALVFTGGRKRSFPGRFIASSFHVTANITGECFCFLSFSVWRCRRLLYRETPSETCVARRMSRMRSIDVLQSDRVKFRFLSVPAILYVIPDHGPLVKEDARCASPCC